MNRYKVVIYEGSLGLKYNIIIRARNYIKAQDKAVAYIRKHYNAKTLTPVKCEKLEENNG